MDRIDIKLMQFGDVRLISEPAGRDNGFQRLSFEVNSSGKITRLIQTAFDTSNRLVHQRPGQAKNNLFDVKLR